MGLSALEEEFAELLTDQPTDPIIGFKTGYLTVISRVSNTEAIAHCSNCNGTKRFNIQALTRADGKATKSCGCINDKKRKKLIDVQFGDLKVIAYDAVLSKYKMDTMWECRCKCGNVIACRDYSLTHNKVTNCGCNIGKPRTKLQVTDSDIKKLETVKRNREIASSRPKYHGRLDYRDLVYGRLTILDMDLGLLEMTGDAYWKCRCECGTEVTYQSVRFANGNTISCGCARNQSTQNEIRRLTQLDEDGNEIDTIAIIVSQGIEYYIDANDYYKVSDMHWHESSRGYAVTHIYKEVNGSLARTTATLHRTILGLSGTDEDDILVDHKNRDTRNNHGYNLRVATPSENSRNQSLDLRNKTGYTGIHKNANGKYVARISVGQERVKLGIFTRIEDAIQARLAAEELYWGEYAPEISDTERKEHLYNKNKA